MITGTPINDDSTKLVVVDTTQMNWEETGTPGVTWKVVERVIDDEKGRETAIVRFAPGTELPPEVAEGRLDLFVLEGSYSDGHGEYGPFTFIRTPKGASHTPSSKDGCTFYIKRRNAFRDDDVRIVMDTTKEEWTAFGHRAAQVIHFYRDRHGIDTSRFGEVFPEKSIPEHDHAMGEETYIVDGMLKDQIGAYKKGTWFRFPSGKPHAPFTEAESCKMLIREGDLHW